MPPREDAEVVYEPLSVSTTRSKAVISQPWPRRPDCFSKRLLLKKKESPDASHYLWINNQSLNKKFGIKLLETNDFFREANSNFSHEHQSLNT